LGTFPQYQYPHALERYCEVARYNNIVGKNDEETLDLLIEKIEQLKKTIGIPASIQEFGIKEEDFLATLDEMVENAFNDQCTGANPRYPLMSEIRQMYLNAYYGNTFRERETPDTMQLERS
jgi:acetaldehyde dehydrogenase/alcohol dehydrogenase